MKFNADIVKGKTREETKNNIIANKEIMQAIAYYSGDPEDTAGIMAMFITNGSDKNVDTEEYKYF